MTIDDPRRNYPPGPVAADDTARLLDDLLDRLILLRTPMRHGDAGAELHALTSLIAEARGRLGRVVADARDQQHSWTEIAGQLGISRVRTIARFAGRTATRRSLSSLD